jgi:hypothetical protein
MKTIKRLLTGLALVATVLAPFYSANAWDRSSGASHRGYWSSGHGSYWHGSRPHGYWGGRRYWGGYYWGGPRGPYWRAPRYYWGAPWGYWGGGCRDCDTAGAAVAGLAFGTILGSAIANSAPPPAVDDDQDDYIEPSASAPPREGCRSIVVRGVTYYNCGERDYGDAGSASGSYQGQADNSGQRQEPAYRSRPYQGQADNSRPDLDGMDDSDFGNDQTDYSFLDDSGTDSGNSWNGK